MFALFAAAALSAGCPHECDCADDAPIRVTVTVILASTESQVVDPKLTDLAMLGGYVAMYETGAYPDGAYGQLVLTVLATGFWVDFMKDTFVFSPHNDLVKSMKLVGLRNEWQRLPVRLGFAAASAGLGYLVLRGYDRMFSLNNGEVAVREGVPVMMPVMSGRF